MDDLTAFITARLDEDEAALRDDDEDQGGRFSDMDEQTSRYVWRFADNDRVRREITAKRAIVALHHPVWEDYVDGDGIDHLGHECAECDTQGTPDSWPCATIRHLAAVWSDHLDYQKDWST